MSYKHDPKQHQSEKGCSSRDTLPNAQSDGTEDVLDKLERVDLSVKKSKFLDKFYDLLATEKLTVGIGTLRGAADEALINVTMTEGELFDKYIMSQLNKTEVVSALQVNYFDSRVEDNPSDISDIRLRSRAELEELLLSDIKYVVGDIISRSGVSGDAFCESTDAIDIIESFSHSFTEEERDELVDQLGAVIQSSVLYLESRLNYQYNYGDVNSNKPINQQTTPKFHSKEFVDLFYPEKSALITTDA